MQGWQEWFEARHKRIADPIHQYVHLSKFEHELINQPFFLRLHGVRQGSLLLSVYPSALTTRYEHSLGTTHLAGEIWREALWRSDATDLRNFGHKVPGAFRKLRGWRGLPEGAKRHVRAEWSYVVRAMLRAAALLHDVGHLPYSHLLEDVARALGKARVPTWRHKEHGLSVVAALVRHYGARKDVQNQLKAFVLDGAHKILIDPAQSVSVFSRLHSLIDGTLDVDRIDYLARDHKFAGTTYGVFDATRITESFLLRWKGRDRLLCQHVRTLSALEQFFSTRYVGLRYTVMHHFVMAIEEAFVRVCTWIHENRRAFAELHKEGKARHLVSLDLDKLFSSTPVLFSNEVFRIGDDFITSRLWTAYDVLNVPSVRTRLQNGELYFQLLRLVLMRKHVFVSLWKLRDEYNSFLKELDHEKEAPEVLVPRGERTREAVNHARVTLLKRLGFSPERPPENEEFGERLMMKWAEIVSELEPRQEFESVWMEELTRIRGLPPAVMGVMVATKSRQKLFIDPDAPVYLFNPETQKLVDILEVSPLIKGLYDVWRSDIQFSAYILCVPEQRGKIKDWSEKNRSKVYKALRRALYRHAYKGLETQSSG